MPIKTAIQSTALTSEAAERCFGRRITADRFRNDTAMESMARALFDKRLHKGEKIRITFESYYGDSAVRNVKEVMETFKRDPAGTIRIVSLNVRQEDSGKLIDQLAKELNTDGLYPMNDLMAGLKAQKTNSLFYTDTQPDAATPRSPFDNTKTFIVIENMTMVRWHMLCSLLKRFLGKWFSEVPMTEFELKNMANGLQKDDPDVFLEAMNAYAETLDLRGQFIREALADFETRFEKERIDALEREVKELDSSMNNHERQILELLTRKEEILATLFGYQTREKAAEPMTMNYFLANKSLVLVSCSASSLEFYDYGWFSNWDPDKARATFEKDHMSSWLESNEQHGISTEDAKMLYKALFVDETVKVRLWSHMRLHLRTQNGHNGIEIISGDMAPDSITNALPNPHHGYNSCIGDNRQYINEALWHRDIIGALEQCIAATKGINLTEHASYQYFASDLFNPKFGKVIYINELNQFMTTKDAIAWLKEHAKA